jgi:hypothetical protein
MRIFRDKNWHTITPDFCNIIKVYLLEPLLCPHATLDDVTHLVEDEGGHE